MKKMMILFTTIIMNILQLSQASLAFYIQVYEGNVYESFRLMERIYRPEPFVYAIHVDAKLSRDSESFEDYQRILDRFEAFSNVYFLKRHPVTYRGVSMLLSTLDGIETLLKASSKWHHFINLSGSDYPLLDPRWMDTVLRDCRGGNRTFMRTDNYNVTRKSALYMSNRYLINWEDGALAGKKTDDVKRYKYHNDGYWYMYNQPTFNIDKGSAWVVLSRDAAQFALTSSSSRWMLAFFSHTCSSPELFFHTVLHQSEHIKKSVVEMDMHFVDWHGMVQHPQVLQLKHSKKVSRSGKLFMRKLNQEKSSELMDYADENLLWYPSSNSTMDPPEAFLKNYNAFRGSCGLKKVGNDVVSLTAFRRGNRVGRDG
jgi:hypothetical protein